MNKKIMIAVCAMGLMGSVSANEIIRTPAENNFPISTVVEVPNTAKTYYLSGIVPSKLEDGTFGANTEVQTVNILKGIESTLQSKGLTLGDVVKMQVYLVADPVTGKMDFAGFMKGYTQFFGTEAQSNTPARSAFEIKALAMPEWLIEIEVIAAK